MGNVVSTHLIVRMVIILRKESIRISQGSVNDTSFLWEFLTSVMSLRGLVFALFIESKFKFWFGKGEMATRN
jgi:hypothetical protein